jgi:hypothetical protein
MMRISPVSQHKPYSGKADMQARVAISARLAFGDTVGRTNGLICLVLFRKQRQPGCVEQQKSGWERTDRHFPERRLDDSHVAGKHACQRAREHHHAQRAREAKEGAREGDAGDTAEYDWPATDSIRQAAPP